MCAELLATTGVSGWLGSRTRVSDRAGQPRGQRCTERRRGGALHCVQGLIQFFDNVLGLIRRVVQKRALL